MLDAERNEGAGRFRLKTETPENALTKWFFPWIPEDMVGMNGVREKVADVQSLRHSQPYKKVPQIIYSNEFVKLIPIWAYRCHLLDLNL